MPQQQVHLLKSDHSLFGSHWWW